MDTRPDHPTTSTPILQGRDTIQAQPIVRASSTRMTGSKPSAASLHSGSTR